MSWSEIKNIFGAKWHFEKGQNVFCKRFIASRKSLFSFKYNFLQIVGHFKNAPVLKLGQAFAPRQFGRKLRVLKDFPKVVDEKNFFFLSFLLTPLWKFHNGVTKIHNGVMKFITALWKSCHNVAARPRFERPKVY